MWHMLHTHYTHTHTHTLHTHTHTPVNICICIRKTDYRPPAVWHPPSPWRVFLIVCVCVCVCVCVFYHQSIYPNKILITHWSTRVQKMLPVWTKERRVSCYFHLTASPPPLTPPSARTGAKKKVKCESNIWIRFWSAAAHLARLRIWLKPSYKETSSFFVLRLISVLGGASEGRKHERWPESSDAVEILIHYRSWSDDVATVIYKMNLNSCSIKKS